MKITSREQALAILAELEQMRQNPPPVFVDKDFPKQAAFIASKANRRAALCTRRAGKSYGVGSALFKEGFDFPGCSVLYLALTRASAKNIMWKDVLKTIDKKHGIGAKPNESELTLRLPNGSDILLAGADASTTEMEKYLGGKYRCVIIDECGSFRQDLRKLIYENLEPAVADYDGWVGMIGTPTEFTKGLFFDVTKEGSESTEGWEIHKWNTFDNPYMRDKWRKRLDYLVSTNPRIVETPAYQRMYLGKWVIDLENLVYKYKAESNDVESMPSDKYVRVLGVDLGFNDASAFVVGAYSEYDPNLYVEHAYKRSGMIVQDVIERIRWFMSNFKDITTVVIDNASKQVVEEIRARFGVDFPLKAAEKHGKSEFIELMNNDYITGKIKLLPDAQPLKEEYASLIWDDRSKRREEHPGCENHCSDAALYMWRYTYQYLSRAKPVVPTEEEKVDLWFEEQARKLEEDEDKPFWERDWE